MSNIPLHMLRHLRTPPGTGPLTFRWLMLLALAALVFAGGVSAATPPISQPGSQPGAAPAAQIGRGTAAAIAPVLERRLIAGGRSNFAITFREKADLAAATAMPWIERGRFVHERLRETAERSQAGVRAELAKRGVTFHPYWISNTILVEDGDLDALRAVAAFANVARIGDVPRMGLIKPEPGSKRAPAKGSDPTLAENLAWIGADQAWADGTTGDGVVVGVIDDGASFRHEALRRQYRGVQPNGSVQHDYNWLSPVGHDPDPRSIGGHGNHVMGTIVGDNGADGDARRRTGVAPGARWIACLGLPTDGSDFALPTCGEFMLAPTTTQGEAPNPDLRPQVVNNSWARTVQCDGSADDFYRDMVDAWIAAGVFPVFAAGNSSGCGLPEPAGLSTVASPAALPSAFAVGSSGNHDGAYAAHSLWGPSQESSPGLPLYPDTRGYPTMKPQVVAPGVDILSAIDDGSGYELMTGTSMSAPHITGLVALMLEAGECLVGDYPTLGTLIMQTARPIDYASGGTPPPGPGNLPNYATGWGEIDAPAAVAAAVAACGDQGFLRGTVTDANGAPINGATIEVFTDEAVRIYQTTSAADGSYVRRLPVQAAPGYTVRVSRYGYLSNTEGGLLVQDGETTRHDVTLADAAVFKISGRVTDANTGWPLHAHIVVGGHPEASVWTDPATGAYSLRLAEGNSYRFDVSSDVPGYIAQSRDIPTLSGGGEQDFALEADLIACAAPGYGYATTLLSEGFDAGSPPAGWSATSAGFGWQFGESSQLWSDSMRIPEHGRIALANEERAPGGAWSNDGSNDALLLPEQDLAGMSNPVLRYASFFIDYYATTVLEASVDGGSTWTIVSRPTPSDPEAGWVQEAVSLAGLSVDNLRLRFHSSDGTSAEQPEAFGIGWAIDDVQVVDGCAPPAGGGLVIGHVRDANTGAALNGAIVRVAGGDQTVSGGSADGNVGDGFFALHAHGGSATLEATRGTLPEGYGDASATVSVANGSTAIHNLALPAGRLRVQPMHPTVTVELGQTATTQMTLSNSGTSALTYALERTAIEEHFDAPSFPPPGWSVTDNIEGCGWIGLDPQEFANYAGGDGSAAYVDPYPCWGGANSDTILHAPPLDLRTSNSASAGFFLALLEGAEAYPRFDVDASIDGGSTWSTVFTERYENNGTGPGALIELDLTDFVGHDDVRVRFHYTATPPWGWVVIDQIHLFDAASMSPMLDLSSDDGSLAIGESRVVDVTFDTAAVNQPGTYPEVLRVAEDTPYDWALGDVEATMIVTPPASFGALRGVVRSLGTCDAVPTTLAGVDVTIVDANGGSNTVTTDADGAYTWWADHASGPFTVSSGTDGHTGATREFVLAAGAETAADLDLRPLLPCLRTDPAAIATSLPADASTDLGFALRNIGAGATDWALRPGGDPTVLSPVPLVQAVSNVPSVDYGFGCFQPGANFTTRNHWMRVFPPAPGTALPQERLVTAFNFGVSQAIALDSKQPVTVRVHRLVGELAFANLELLGERTLQVVNQTETNIRVVFDPPLQTAADATLVAEIEVPSGIGEGAGFFVGGNTEGESAPSYWASIDCGEPEPVPYSKVGYGFINLIVDLETLASDACGANTAPVPWLALSDDAGSLAGDGSVPLQATFDAAGLSAGSHHGSICITPGSAGGTATVPVTLDVTGGGGDTAVFADGFE